MTDFLNDLNSLIWSNPLIYLCLGSGVYFSIRSRFLQIRHIPEMIRVMIRGESSPDGGVSSFQALMISLAGRVGTGNIAGVATAIAFGGPGALFWMWAMAFLGASTSFVECTLGQIYKTRDRLTNEYRGGPAYYFSKAFAHTRAAPFFKVYGLVFAAVTVLACGLLMPSVQSNSMAVAMSQAWGGIADWAVAIGIVIILAFVIIGGGVKRIATFASIVVPFMAVLYILFALIVVFTNAGQIPRGAAIDLRERVRRRRGVRLDHRRRDHVGGRQARHLLQRGRSGHRPARRCRRRGLPPRRSRASSRPSRSTSTHFFVCSATGFLIISTGAYRVFEGESADGAVLGDGGLLPRRR